MQRIVFISFTRCGSMLLLCALSSTSLHRIAHQFVVLLVVASLFVVYMALWCGADLHARDPSGCKLTNIPSDTQRTPYTRDDPTIRRRRTTINLLDISICICLDKSGANPLHTTHPTRKTHAAQRLSVANETNLRELFETEIEIRRNEGSAHIVSKESQGISPKECGRRVRPLLGCYCIPRSLLSPQSHTECYENVYWLRVIPIHHRGTELMPQWPCNNKKGLNPRDCAASLAATNIAICTPINAR